MRDANSPNGAAIERGDERPGAFRADIAVVALLLALAAFQTAAVQRLESWNSDSAAYMSLADNLASGAGYTLNFEPHTLYPPGFPLLLAGVRGLFGSADYTTAIRLMPAIGALGLIAWYFALRAFAAAWAAGAACLLVATSPAYFRLATQSVLSELPYLAASGLCAWSVLASLRPAAGRRRPVALALGACSAAVVAVLIRSAGISLVVALALWAIRIYGTSATGRAPRTAAAAALLAAAAGGAALLAWNQWSGSRARPHYEGDSYRAYSSQFRLLDPHRPELGVASPADLAFRAAKKAAFESAQLVRILARLEWIEPSFRSPAVALAFVWLAAGAAIWLADAGGSLAALYFGVYFGLYCFWPFGEGVRFMLPIAPVGCLLALAALPRLARAVADRPLLASAALATAAGVAAMFSPPDESASFQARAGAWIWRGLAAAGLLGAVAAGRVPSRSLARLATTAPHWIARAIRSATVALAIAGLAGQARIARGNLRSDASQFRHAPTADAANWLRSASEGAVMAQQVHILHRLSGRRAVAFPIARDGQAIASTAARHGVRYLIVNDPVDNEYYFPTEVERWEALERYAPGSLKLVRHGPGYRIFEFERP